MPMNHFIFVFFALGYLLLALWAHSAMVFAADAGNTINPATELEKPSIEVIGIMPLPGLGVPRQQVPTNVQAVSGAEMQKAQTLNLPEFLANRLPSVNLNEIQGNPFQADVNYRGFSASPLLGTPQGLSVYLDGVRMNEPFGDVVNWDAIPQPAISALNLIPGSNPLFGLNTLGGALSLRTKSGENYPGLSVQASGGAFGRYASELEYGGSREQLGWYISGNHFVEDGWRDFSPSKVGQVFAKLGWQTDDSDFDLSLLHADADLVGNGLVPLTLFEQRRSQVFTVPDHTLNRLALANLTFSHALSDSPQHGHLIAGNAYYRISARRTLNGDINDDFAGDPLLDGAAGAGVGGSGFNQDTGGNNRTRTTQRGYGMAAQWTRFTQVNRLTLGASFDGSRSDFEQTTALGLFDTTRRVVAAGGDTLENSLQGRTRTISAYATDTFALTPQTHLTLSGRYNSTRVTTVDRLTPFAPNLDGDFTYRKFNPAIGLTHNPHSAWTLYAGYSQGNRAPSPIELGCADPANPCTLPNALASDPYLKQVVARTLEAGLRGKLTANVQWNAGVFRTINQNDILFISSGTSAGYFTNFGQTRRQGIEAALSGKNRHWRWTTSYSLVDATFQSSVLLRAENNSTRGAEAGAADDEIAVRPDNRIPGIPRHSLKFSAEYEGEGWAAGANLLAYSQQYARGNENNQHTAGSTTNNFGNTRTFLGSGTAPGYAVLNVHARMQLAPGWELFGKINNLLDKKYFTAAALAQNPFDAAGAFQTNSDFWSRDTFYAPGAPRALWVGVRYVLDGKTSSSE